LNIFVNLYTCSYGKMAIHIRCACSWHRSHALYSWWAQEKYASLAAKLGFEFIGDGLPAALQMDCYPMSEIKLAWNVIEGTLKGMKIVIFDSIIGSGRGRYCTTIACHTTKSLFALNYSGERIAQCNGWTALYRRPFFPLNPGTISVSRLEDLVGTI